MNLEFYIKRRLKETQKTVKQLADGIGMSETNVYNIFKRDSVETKALLRIAEFLDVHPSYFFGSSIDNSHSSNQSGSGNVQVAHSKNRDFSNTHTSGPSKTSDNVITDLEVCKKEVEYLKRENDLLRNLLDRK
jgi:DNA-binding Xre family transcriptional regulator